MSTLTLAAWPARGRELFPGVLGAIAIPALAGFSGLISAMTIANVSYLKGSDALIGGLVALVILLSLGGVKLSQSSRRA